MEEIQPKVNTNKKPCKLKFKKLNKKDLQIGEDEVISPTYVTMVENNSNSGYKEVKISREQMKASVGMLSMVPQKQKNPQDVHNSDKYIEELESGKRPNEYGLGDPNSKSFEPDYSGTLEQTEHKHMMEHLDKIPQYIAEIRSKNNQEQENNEEKPNADKYIFGDPNSSTFEVDYSKQYELEDHKYVMDIIKTIGKNEKQENNENNENIEK